MQDQTVPHDTAAAEAAAARKLAPSTTGPQPTDARFSAGIAAFFRSSRESRIAQQRTPQQSCNELS